MNDKRRTRLRKAISLLESAQTIVDTAKDEEWDSLDNMPESFIDTERYSDMQDIAEKLDEAYDGIDLAIGCIKDVV